MTFATDTALSDLERLMMEYGVAADPIRVASLVLAVAREHPATWIEQLAVDVLNTQPHRQR
jgi:hypothetical protein